MAEFEDPPRETRRDPGVTHADRTVGETRHDAGQAPSPAVTRRDGLPPADPLVRLPGPLAQRFTVVGELPVQGAESDLVRVRDATGDDQVVKIFRRGYGADREVWRKLPELDSPHVVRILETGHADGRDYEVIEYAPAGNLRALMGDRRLPVADVVSQLAAGLDHLHRADIVHRDLKPENVLVASERPLRLVITDFGLSKVIEQSVVFASSSRTLAYAAPESLSGQVSPARDWWSLGMIVRELATGRPPFLGMSETAVVDHLATRPVANDDIEDPRLRLLCQGLLTRDPRRRWHGAQVAQWLSGESPAVTPEPAAEHPAGPGLPFGGRRYTDRAELAGALVADWDAAARYFFARGTSSEAWRSLRDWLAAFADDDSRIELIDEFLSGPLPPDVKLLHLVRWLHPARPPHYLGHRLTADDLPRLAALAGDPAHADHRTANAVGRALWDHRLLPVLAGFAGGAELGDLDARWRGRVEAWDRLAGRLHERLPPPVAARLPEAGAPGRDDPPVVLLTLLALAARPAETAQALAAAADRARSAVREPVQWFQWLADGAGDDPLRHLAVVRTAPQAVLAAEARERDRQTTEQQATDRRLRWAETERRRLAGRRAAVTRAVLWTLPLLAFWLFGSWLVDQLFSGTGDGTRSVGGIQRGSGAPFAVLPAFSCAAWAVACGGEVVLATRQGKDYLPTGPWAWLSRILGAGGRGLSSASKAMSGTARRSGRRGCGLLLIAGIVPLLLILILFSALATIAWALWLMAMVIAAVAHAIGAGVRLHRWRQTHEQHEREALKVAQ